jgi:hypothetical protein
VFSTTPHLEQLNSGIGISRFELGEEGVQSVDCVV